MNLRSSRLQLPWPIAQSARCRLANSFSSRQLGQQHPWAREGIRSSLEDIRSSRQYRTLNDEYRSEWYLWHLWSWSRWNQLEVSVWIKKKKLQAQKPLASYPWHLASTSTQDLKIAGDSLSPKGLLRESPTEVGKVIVQWTGSTDIPSAYFAIPTFGRRSMDHVHWMCDAL